MTDPIVRVAFDATLEEYLDVQMRQVRRSKASARGRLRSMIYACAAASIVGVAILHDSFGGSLGIDLVVATVLAGCVASLYGPMYDRSLVSGVRRTLSDQYGARLPARCEIELRPACLWVRQDGVEIAFDWSTTDAVEDTPEGIEVWSRWGLVVARNRGFATSSDRERFMEQARALSMSAKTRADGPSA